MNNYITITETLNTEQLWWRRNDIFWGGGLSTIKELTFVELDKCIETYKEITNSEITDLTKLNDFFWFEDDTIREIIGRNIWED